MDWNTNLQQQDKHRYDGFWPLDVDLSDRRTLEYVPLTGDSLHILNLSGRVEIRFNKPNNPPLILDPLDEIRSIKTVFTGLYLSNEPQVGALIRLAAGVNFDLDRQPGRRPTRIVISSEPMIGASISWIVPIGTVSLALRAVGGDVGIKSHSMGAAWTLADGEKEVINADLGGQTLYFDGANGVNLIIRRLIM